MTYQYHPPGFAAWSTPEYVVISSSGREAGAAAVRSAYQARGATVLHTADCGAVTVVLDSNGVDVQPFQIDNSAK